MISQSDYLWHKFCFKYCLAGLVLRKDRIAEELRIVRTSPWQIQIRREWFLSFFLFNNVPDIYPIPT